MVQLSNMNNSVKSLEPFKITRKIPGPTVVLFCLIAMITLFSPELGAEHLVLSVIAGTVACAAIFLRWRAGGGLSAAVIGVVSGLFVMAWQQTSMPSFPVELQKAAVMVEGVVLDRNDRNDSIQIILDRALVSPEQNAFSAPINIPGRIVITSRQKQPMLAVPGDQVRLHARLKPIKSFRNPGSFDYARFQRQRGIFISGFSRKPIEIVEVAVEKSWNRYRQTSSQWIMQVLPSEEQGLAEALMVGKRGLLSATLKEHLLVSGTFHLIAISGLHMGIVAGWSFFLFRLLLALCLPFSRRWDVKRPAATLTLFPTICYAFLAGWSVPTIRATTMVCLLLLAISTGRSRHVWRVLNIAAIVMLLYQPWQLFSVGFQLSFLSVVGLLFFLPLFQHGQSWRKKILGILLVSLVTMLVTTPIVAHYFHRVTPYGLLANVISVPWVSMVSTPLGLLAMLTHEIYPPLGDVLLLYMGDTLALFQWVITWISELPNAWQRLPGPSLIGIALSLGFCALAGLVGMVGMGIWRKILFICAFPALLWPRPTPPAEQLHLAVLDVGQAQSVVLYTPDGGWSVLDAGGWSSPRFNMGEAVISTYLWFHGVRHLKRLVISHPQRDHMAGAERLLRNFEVDTLWLGDFPEEEQKKVSYMNLISRAEKEGVRIQRIHQKMQIEEGDVMLTVLPPLPRKWTKNSNARSLVVEVAFGGQRFLMPGDAMAQTERWLLTQQVIQPLTVLLAPHHGSKSSSTAPFVQATYPKHVVFSVGFRNAHHHPHPQVVRRWRAVGSKIWRTDHHGAVIFQSDGKLIHVKVAAKPNDFRSQKAEWMY